MKYWLALHICAGIVCDVTQAVNPYPTMKHCGDAGELSLEHVKKEPEAYRFIVRGAPGEIKAQAYACVRRVE